MVNIFTYGSLMCSDIMFAAANYQAESSKAILKHYYRSRIHNEEYPGIIPDPTAQVDGVVYWDLPKEAVERLDIFEGEYYCRETVQVDAGALGEIDAMTYVIKPQCQHLLTNTEWSYAHFLEVGKPKFENAYFGFRDIQEPDTE